MNHKQQGILQDYGTVMSKENRPFFCGLDIAEYLAVVGMDDVRQRLAGMHKDQGDRSLIFYFERGRDSGVKATSVFSSG